MLMDCKSESIGHDLKHDLPESSQSFKVTGIPFIIQKPSFVKTSNYNKSGHWSRQ